MVHTTNDESGGSNVGSDVDEASNDAPAESEPTADNRLSASERDRRDTLERIIGHNLRAFTEAGRALSEMRDSRLYRDRYRNFRGYALERWGLRLSRAYQLIDAAAAVDNLTTSTMVETPPANERQVRPLTKLPPDQQRQVWEEAVATAPSGPGGAPVVTGAHVEAVARQMRGRESQKGDENRPAHAATESPPWAKFNEGVNEVVIGHLRKAYAAFADLAGYTGGDGGKRFTCPWAQGYSPMGTLGTINQLIRAFANGLPARPVDQSPGFITVERLQFLKSIRKK